MERQKALSFRDELLEQGKSILELEKSVIEIHELSQDLSRMVSCQGQLIDSIELNVNTAAGEVQEGREELRKAEKISCKIRKRKAFLCFLGTVILGIIVGAIVLAILL